jgi:hypothetical protein
LLDAIAKQAGIPPWPGIFVGAADVLVGWMVDAGSEVYSQFAVVTPEVAGSAG